MSTKCSTKQANIFAQDLWQFLEIRGENQSLFNTLVEFFQKYSEEVIREKYQELMCSCTLPNGQISGSFPKLEK